MFHFSAKLFDLCLSLLAEDLQKVFVDQGTLLSSFPDPLGLSKNLCLAAYLFSKEVVRLA